MHTPDFDFEKMLAKCDILNREKSGSEYVSCIKVNGKPILPPLITPERRLELEGYKREALNYERRMKCQRELKNFIDNLDCCKLQLEKKIGHDDVQHRKRFERTIENTLSFGSDENVVNADALNRLKIFADISANNSNSNDSQNNQNEMPFNNETDNSKGDDNAREIVTDVPLNVSRQNRQTLTCNIFDVTEYNENGIVMFHHNGTASSHNNDNKTSVIELDLSDVASSEKKSTDTSIDSCQSRPRIRSNSYTLESPSPLLLEHLKKQAKSPSFCYAQKRRSLDLGIKTSLECVVSKENSSMSSGIVADADATASSYETESVHKAIEDLAEKHFGSNEQKRTETDNKSNNETANYELLSLNETNLELQDLPENYIKDIIEFLERHKNEQDTKIKSIQESLRNNKNESIINGTKLPCDNLLDLSEFEVNNPLDRSTPHLIDFESDSYDTEPITYYDGNSSFTYSESMRTCSYSNSESQISQRDNSGNCNKELFPEDPKKAERRLKQHWAATILTAAAKGYLVRRLKRTERVSNLIQTIQEALVCAMSLHSENSDKIKSADVELHRRLIQQVSAACYEFYDIFFNLTTKEQMILIALDRQRIQEKLKRPRSVTSAKSNSNRSSTTSMKSQHSQGSGKRKTKSATPTYAA